MLENKKGDVLEQWAGGGCRARERSAAFPDDEDVQCLGSCDLFLRQYEGFFRFVHERRGSRCQSLVWSCGSERSKVTSGLSCFPLGALRFGLGSLCLPGAFRTAGGDGSSGGRWIRLSADDLILAVRSFKLVVLQTAQLSCGGPGTQRPLLVSLAEGVGAELAEGLRVFPADVTMVPGAVPASCRDTVKWSQVSKAEFK